MSWERSELQSLILPTKGALVSGPFGSNIGSRFFVDEGIPIIRGNNLTKGEAKFIDDGFAFLTEEKAAEFSNCIAVTDDIIFTAAGSIGQVGIIPKETRFDHYIISNKQIRARLDKEKVEPMFVFYWLSSPIMAHYLENMNNGGAVPLLNLGIIRRVPVPVPPIETQRKIVSILSAYNDLIENNRRRIDLLEQSARHLYKEWFVSLRFPGHEHIEVKDGVPQGWEKTTLGEIAPLNYGKGLKADERIPGAYPVYGSSGIVGTHEKALVVGPGIIVGRKGNAGSAFWSMSDFYPIDTTYYIASSASSYFLYYLLLNTQFVSSDVAVPGLNRDYAHSLKILLPPKNLLSHFEANAESIRKQIFIVEKYSETLAQTRDLLLPRLMNGEISV